MRITADTNVLVRALTEDDPVQGRLAQAALAAADQVVITVPALCELVWVLSRGYRVSARKIGETLRQLVASERVSVDAAAVATGLAVFEAGGDFADGAIAHLGFEMGADAFVSFDARAVRAVEAQGFAATLLG